MLILMDGSVEAERLLDCSKNIFQGKNDYFKGAFIEGIGTRNLHEVFDSGKHLSNQYTRSEIIEKILHTDLNNSSEFIERFVNKCEELALKTNVYLCQEDINDDLVNESQFSDLFVVGKDIFKRPDLNKQSFESIEYILRNTRCPILLLSCDQPDFKNLVLIYDGSNRSFEAIRVFTYLMGDQLLANKVVLNVVVTENSSTNERSVIDYLKHYQPHFYVHRVYPENYYNELRNLLVNLDSFLLVSGVNRNDILEDMIFNKDQSFFMHGQRSVFLA